MPIEPSDDSLLLKQIRNADAAAFRRLYDRHYRKVYQFANSFLRNKEASEEILQETFLKIWVNRDKINSELPIQPLLFTLSKRLVIDAVRKAAALHRQNGVIAFEMQQHDSGTEEKIIFADLLTHTQKAIDRLPRQQQTVVRLSKFEGLSYDEISQRLDISKNTVKNHLIVAMKTLRNYMDKEGMFYFFVIFFFV